jgi:thiol-disulfide isomerase/thioredoxin
MKKIIYIMLLCLSAQQLQAQLVKSIDIGAQLPNFPIKFSYNDNKAITDINSLKGKVVIFDFWNTTCTSCIQAFPELEALQKQFKDELVIISVTRDSKKKVQALFDKSVASHTTLPMITGDTTLIKYFTVKLPHHGWLDKNGKVIAIAHGYNATAKNIEKAIKGEPLKMMFFTQIRNFDTNLPLALNPNVDKANLMKQYSLLSGYMNGITMGGGGVRDPKTDKVTWRSYYNKSIINLLKFAYGDFKSIDNPFGSTADAKNVELNVSDTSRFLPPNAIEDIDAWRYDNFYCYEIGVLPKDADKLAIYMQQDLQRYFNIKVEVRIRKTKAMELLAGPGLLKAKSEGGMDYIESTVKEHALWNQSLAQTAFFFNQLRFWPAKFVPSPTANFNIDLKLDKSQLKNSEKALAYLKSKGFVFKETEIEEPYLYVTDL